MFFRYHQDRGRRDGAQVPDHGRAAARSGLLLCQEHHGADVYEENPLRAAQLQLRDGHLQGHHQK